MADVTTRMRTNDREAAHAVYAPTRPITRIVRHRATSGLETEYEFLINELFALLAETPGFIDAELVPPTEVGGEFLVITHFESEDALARWDATPERAQIQARIREVADDEPEYRRLTGLEAWFDLPRTHGTPARHRLAVATWLGIFPTVSLYLWLLAPNMVSWPFLVRTAVLTALVVATMTWVVAPVVTRFLRGWLTR